MAGRGTHEPTQPKNPHQLTVKQHIHSEAAIQRFADAKDRVAVLRRGTPASFPAHADNDIFVAKRVWDQHTEAGALFTQVEAAFQAEVDSVLATQMVSDHLAVSAYMSIWRIRARLAEDPPKDVVLHGVAPSPVYLTKDMEEVIESKHCAVVRGNLVPARFNAFVKVRMDHDANMAELTAKNVFWSVLRDVDGVGFLCPDRPVDQLFIPLTPNLALIATGSREERLTVSAIGVEQANRESQEQALRCIFGHPRDMAAHLARTDDAK